MRSRLAPALLALTVLVAPLAAADAPPKPAAPAPAAGQDSDITVYYFCLLSKGLYAGVGLKEERKKTQAAELAYIDRLARQGKLLASGPILDESECRGIYIFKCATLAEARDLVLADPEVSAGRLRFEIHPWTTAKGTLGADPAR